MSPSPAAAEPPTTTGEVVATVFLVCFVLMTWMVPTWLELIVPPTCIDQPIVAKTVKDQCPKWLTTRFLRQAAVAEYHSDSPTRRCREWKCNRDKMGEELTRFYLDSVKEKFLELARNDLQAQFERIDDLRTCQ